MKLLTPAILIFFLYSTSLCQAQVNNSSISAIERPKLVVGLVVDQMRWDYLIRYYERFGNGGFRRLMRDGYNFESASIPYGPTVTAAGHTCIYSGSVPALHGIVGNDWVENNTGEIMYCTRDRNVQPAGGTTVQGQMSPRNLLISTFPDELRIATNFRSRSFGIAMKDRGGILAAGHAANAAYWFEDFSGKWISSTWYMASLPAWVDKFNDQRQPDTYLRKGWDLLYPMATYLQSTRDSQAYEKKLPDEITTTFPHRYAAKPNDYYPFRVSPYGNTYTLDFAETLIREEKLGKSGFTDVLCVSLSSTDYIAHRFGPNSLEAEDTYLRLDKELEKFFLMLDAYAGKGNYLLFLTADHGASAIPGFYQEHKMPGGNLKMNSVRLELNKVLKTTFRQDSLVPKIFDYQVYLDEARIRKASLDRDKVKEAVMSFFRDRPEVLMVFDYDHLAETVMQASIKEKLINGFYARRSGAIQVLLKPNYDDVDWSGTEHGTIYNYDTHIPLIFYGWHIPKGKTFRPISMTDIAPTISALLQIQSPSGSIGKVLDEIVK